MSLGDHLSLRRQLRCLQLRPDPICGQDRLRRECRRRPDEHEPGHLLRRPPAGHRHPRANPRCHGNPWASHPGNSAYNATRIQLQAQRSGVSYLLSRVSAAGITDGTASTYLIGGCTKGKTPTPVAGRSTARSLSGSGRRRTGRGSTATTRLVLPMRAACRWSFAMARFDRFPTTSTRRSTPGSAIVKMAR